MSNMMLMGVGRAPAFVMPPPSSTLDPANTSPRVNLSAGNLIMTMNAGADRYDMSRCTVGRGNVDGKFAFSARPAPVSGGATDVGFCDSTTPLNGSSFASPTPSLNLAGNGGYYFNGDGAFSGYPGIPFNGSNWITLLMIVSGSGTVRKLYEYYLGYGWGGHLR
ncbi:hypothetical protein KRR38_25105 [Novosphingobium sp. G106]|uniref:hypothetical protein n=1 Tax=Novosphingobium sp. G106 TaxID=2849500 RepID=UPI001C2D2A90|nr:hypothetical protein [Novosphingobium sp. G106]MBV1690867.1 hypothetical protein [Novosphingobium sp. G106]